MRLRLSLTLTVERAEPDSRRDEAPQVDEKSAAPIEGADPAPVGFAIPGGQTSKVAG